MTTSKTTPTFNLERFKELIRQRGMAAFCKKALDTMRENILPEYKGNDFKGFIFDIIGNLCEKDFYKTMPSKHEDHVSEYQDVYRPVVDFGGNNYKQLYIKFTLRTENRIVLSFKFK